MRGPSQAVVQAYLGLKLGVWAYNGTVKHWEPVVEPWDVIAQCAANYGPRVRAGLVYMCGGGGWGGVVWWVDWVVGHKGGLCCQDMACRPGRP